MICLMLVLPLSVICAKGGGGGGKGGSTANGGSTGEVNQPQTPNVAGVSITGPDRT